jgi:type VI secretion system protein ImpE
VPFHRIRRIDIEPPADLRDFVWTPAQVTWANGGEAVALIPTRYPGTEAAPDPALRLSRRTEWQEQSEQTYFGLGQRAFVTDNAETALLDVRRIDIDPAGEAEPAAA